MKSIMNLAKFLYENWTAILIVVSLVIGIVKKTIDFKSKPREKQVKAIKTILKNTMLDYVTNAEVEYSEWRKSGDIKRSQVIKKIYEDYPILSKVVDQKGLEEWMDDTIDESLDSLRDIIEEIDDKADVE